MSCCEVFLYFQCGQFRRNYPAEGAIILLIIVHRERESETERERDREKERIGGEGKDMGERGRKETGCVSLNYKVMGTNEMLLTKGKVHRKVRYHCYVYNPWNSR